jgi:uncharacterized protein YciI
MWYAIMSEDVESSLPNRSKARPQHLARIEQLLAEGRLMVAGPHPACDSPEPGKAGFTGSLVIADFPSLEAAQRWANDDPYNAAGVYRQMTVKPFIRVLP